MSKFKSNIDKLTIIQNNLNFLLDDIYHKEDYFKNNNNRHNLNEIIIKNQNDLLRIHDNKLKNVDYRFNIIIISIIIIILKDLFYLFIKLI